MFLGEFTNWLAGTLMDYTNVIMPGDFNMHTDKKQPNDYAEIFGDTTEAMGLKIVNSGLTHIHGNTWDLVLTECYSSVKIIYSRRPFLSDHCVVEVLLNIPKSDIVQ